MGRFRRMILRELLTFYDEDRGFILRSLGWIPTTIFNFTIHMEISRHQRHVENIDFEKGQVELLGMLLEKKEE